MTLCAARRPAPACSSLQRAGGVGVIAVAFILLIARPASAHGIGGDAATASVPGFVGIGIEHMLLGWDHLLFVAGIVLLAGGARRGAKIISAFVAGHSLTLITATLAGWQLNAALVDVVIVLSVAFVGGYGMFGQPRRWDLFTAIVFGFGLVHGLGLSTRFQGIGVADEGMVWRLLAFNIGVEVGQLTAIVGFLGFAAVVSLAVKRTHEAALTKVVFVALFAVGSMVAPFLALEEFRSVDGDVSVVALPDDSGCTVDERTQTFPAVGGGHTDKTFYEPGESVPVENFGHSLADGYIVVLYPDDLSDQDLDRLRAFVTESEPAALLAGTRDDDNPQVSVVTQDQQMTCETVHVGALRMFSRAWFESIGYDA